MKHQSSRHNRRSIRLKEYDYSQPGAYFVTIVTQGHKCIFGKIISSKMLFSDVGRIAKESWLLIPEHFTNVEVDPYVIMPNHIHGIITIHDDSRRGTIYRAPTEGKKIENFGRPISGSLPTIIRSYKSAVSRRGKQELGIVNIWQRNYYEHIVRGQDDLGMIDKYIEVNPESWLNDPDYRP